MSTSRGENEPSENRTPQERRQECLRPHAPAGRNKGNPMRDAKRALGECSAHRPRLKGATFATFRFRGAVAPFRRAVFSFPAPSGVPPHGVIFVPRFTRISREASISRYVTLLLFVPRFTRSRCGNASGSEAETEGKRPACLRPRGVPADSRSASPDGATIA